MVDVPDPAWFGVRLKELRLAAGLTQKQLAQRAGVAATAVGGWETGMSWPGWRNVLALCTALGVDPNAFAQKPTSLPAEKPRPGRPRKASALPAAEPLALEGELKEDTASPLSLPPAQAKHPKKSPRKPRGG